MKQPHRPIAHDPPATAKKQNKFTAEAAVMVVIGDRDVKFDVFKLNPTPTVLMLMSDLGIPEGYALACVSILAPGRFWGPEFSDYTAEFIGTMVKSVERLTPCTVLKYEPLLGEVLLWRRRVFYKAGEVWQPDRSGLKSVLSPLSPQRTYLESRWHPFHRTEKPAAPVLSEEDSQEYLDRVLFGRHLLRKIVSTSSIITGRRPNLDNVDVQDVIDIYACLWAEHQHDNYPPPTQTTLSAYFGVDRTTLYRHLKYRLKCSYAIVAQRGKERAHRFTPEILKRINPNNKISLLQQVCNKRSKNLRDN